MTTDERNGRFSASQMACLNVLMELLLPASADGRMPAAASLALYDDVTHLPAKDRALLDAGLSLLDERSHSQYGAAFAKLAHRDATKLVDMLRTEKSPFIQTFTLHTVARYLQHDHVMPLIGLEARPPWPKGHAVAQGDWSLIDVVRKRPKIYRQVP